MKTQSFQPYLVPGLLLVVGLMGGYVLGESRAPVMEGHRMPDGTVMQGATMNMASDMSGMMAGLEGKQGDEFDKAFLSEMIVHHQGAVDMAQATLANGKHTELKEFSKAIIEAQSKEIAQMKDWQRTWYGQ